MGSQVILDIIVSSIMFGSLLVMALRLNGSVDENLQMYSGDLIVQDNIVSVTNLIEYDFRKIGYCQDPSKLPDPSTAIILADSNRIMFYTDFRTADYPDGDGNLDILYYYLGPTSELSMTPNPNDRILYRVENDNPPKGASLGVTTFNLMYFDALKDILPTPVASRGAIWAMQITVQVENLAATTLRFNTASFDRQYSSAFWRQVRLVSRNLRNR